MNAGAQMLSLDDLKKHAEYVNMLLTSNIVGGNHFDDLKNSSVAVCPNNLSHKVVKNGCDKNGRQRYHCRKCNKTFFAVENALCSNVCQDISTWVKFIRGMLEGDTIEELSEECSIGKPTAHTWRLRVFSAIEYLLKEVKLSGVIEADDTRVSYSLKGNRSVTILKFHRSRKRGGQNTAHNKNNNQICVLCGIDNEGRSFSEIIGFGNPNGARVVKGFERHLNLNSENILVTDGAPCFKAAIKKYNFKQWDKKTTITKGGKRLPDTSGEHNIQAVNSLHKKLKLFLKKYNGVSSRYLPGYLRLFDYIQNNRNIDKNSMCRDILSAMAVVPKCTNQTLENRYIIPVSNGPETEFWERKVPKIEQQIYKAYVNGTSARQIAKKYKTTSRKVYYIKSKVTKYGLHDAIIDGDTDKKNEKFRTPRPISQRSLEIFMYCYHDGHTLSECALKFNISPQAVHKTINRLKARQEVAHIKKYERPQKHKKKYLDRNKRKEINEEIYIDYIFLKDKGYVIREITQILSCKYSLSPNRIYSRLIESRNAHGDQFRYHHADERHNLSRNEYYTFLNERNMKIREEIKIEQMKASQKPKTEVLRCVAQKYGLSVRHVYLIASKTQKDIVEQKSNEKNVKQQEQTPG